MFTAIAYPCIVVLRKAEQADSQVVSAASSAVRVLNWQPGPPVEQFIEVFCRQSFTLPQSSFKSDGWRLESNIKLKLLERIRAAGTPLGDYCKGRFYYGIKTGLNEAFVIDRQTRDRLIAEHPSSAEILKPFLRGRDVKRWRVESRDLWLIFTRHGIDIEKYPAIHEYLLPFKQRLMPGAPDGRKPGSYKWYEIQDNIAYWQEFEQPKIVVPAITNMVNYAPDSQGYYSNDKTSIFIPPSMPFALAIANSSVSWWFTQQTFASKQGGFFEFKPMYFSQLPIPKATVPQQKTVEMLAEYLLWLNQIKTDVTPRIISHFEQFLNGLVYELFFPDELQAQKLTLFKHIEDAQLLVLDSVPENQRLAVVQETFERLNEPNHPVQECLYSLGSVESVRIIEGEGGTDG